MVYSALLAIPINMKDDGELIIAGLAFIASLVAIIISVISLRQNKSLNITNLQARYFERIFTEYFVDKIPNAVEKVKFENGMLNKKYKILNNTMMDMIGDSKYFAYAKPEFYLEMKKMTIDLEDKLIECASKNVSDKMDQERFIYKIHEEVMKIIKFINKNYHNF